MAIFNELPGVDGLFWWKDKQLLISVVMGRIFVFSDQTTAPIEISTETVRLNVNRKVHFAATDSMLFMANGNSIIKWLGSGKAVLENPDLAPSFCNGLVVFQQRLLAVEENTQRIHLTEAINEKDTTVTWKPTWFSPNANSDYVTQIIAGWSELTIFGPYSMEIWYYTGIEETETDVPFARLEGAAIERGLGAPDSTIVAFNTIWWLDQERRICRLEGRLPKIISLPIDRQIRGLEMARDCRGFQLDRWLVWTFPNGNVTWVFDTVTESWSNWGRWDADFSRYDRYWGQDAVYTPEWSRYFVAGYKDARIFIAAPSLVTDMGGPIRTLYRSGHIDHGTMARKRSDRLMMRLKRGAPANATVTEAPTEGTVPGATKLTPYVKDLPGLPGYTSTQGDYEITTEYGVQLDILHGVTMDAFAVYGGYAYIRQFDSGGNVLSEQIYAPDTITDFNPSATKFDFKQATNYVADPYAPTPMGDDRAVFDAEDRSMTMRWRDSMGDWSREEMIDLGAQSDMFPMVRRWRLGMYRTRQWEFVFPADVVQCLVSVEEDVEVLR